MDYSNLTRNQLIGMLFSADNKIDKLLDEIDGLYSEAQYLNDLIDSLEEDNNEQK